MTTSLIITTYNWKEALKLVILSALNQSVPPDEIIIADDGSRNDTKELIQELISSSTIPIIHSWQEDENFRAAKSRNKAIAKSTSEYIVLTDGDMILHHDFIKEHIKFARKNHFIQGSRVLLSEEKSNEILKNMQINISFYESGLKNRMNAMHSNLLSVLISKTSEKLKGIKTCNMSFYKTDCYQINGFNEDFIGWGREDSEFVVRFFNVGLKRQNIKFNAIAFHIWHNENSRKSLQKNDEILENTINNNLSFCENGINKY